MILTILISTLIGLFNSIMDRLTSGKDFYFSKKSTFFAKTSESWTRKYKEGSLEPRFFGSTFWFVFTTDLWHLAKQVFTTLIFFALPFYVSSFQDAVIAYSIYVSSFHIFKYLWDVDKTNFKELLWVKPTNVILSLPAFVVTMLLFAASLTMWGWDFLGMHSVWNITNFILGITMGSYILGAFIVRLILVGKLLYKKLFKK